MSALPLARPRPLALLAREARLLGAAAACEMRRHAAFRAGFLVREVLRGIERPAVMIFVFAATFRSSGATTIRGYTLGSMVGYLVLAALVSKILIHERALDVSEQIFDGYVTKYTIMPLRYFTLVLARFVQFTAVQLAVTGVLAIALWGYGPSWLAAASPAAVGGALLLALLGSYCFLLTYFTLHALAFWLDVVWTLLAMTRMVSGFVMGELVPVSIMPAAVASAFSWLFPYWALSAPVEILLGRLGPEAVARGLAVEVAWAAALQALALTTWRRGLARYGGSGM